MSRVQVLDGFTAYGIAVKHGFHGTEEEWLESLRANGNVNPVAADETMTIPVGVDDAGRLYSGKDPDVDQLKSDLAKLESIVKVIQEKLGLGTVDTVTVNEINDMIVEYFENKTVSEVEA